MDNKKNSFGTKHFFKTVVQKPNSVKQMRFFIVFNKKTSIFLLNLLFNLILTSISINYETA